MEAGALETRSGTPKRLIFKDPFGVKTRLRKELVPVQEDATPSLDSQLWSRLPEEVLLQVFARLPVKDILRMRSLNQTWRSCITSPHFQAALEGASLVRMALMVHDKVDGTMFLTQDDGQECFRPGIARSPEIVSITRVTATVNGLVCLIEHKKKVRIRPEIREIRVFVVNVVTGVRRALPHPSDMPRQPSFVRMDALQEGGYMITFLYDRTGCIRMSWEVYNSVENRWSKNEEESMALLNDRALFTCTLHCCLTPASFYVNVGQFLTKARDVKLLNLYASHADFCDGKYIVHSVHDVSGAYVYRLGERGGQHGVWRKNIMKFQLWELVCACLRLEKIWTCLRVINDVVVLLVKLPYHCQADAQLLGGLGIDVRAIVKVFHMPTKSWHSFPEEDYVLHNWGVSIQHDHAGPFLVELKFDVVP